MVVAGSGPGAVGAMIWASYFKDYFNTQHFKLILDSIPQSNPSASGSLYETSLLNMMKLANIDGQHPFVLCYLRNLGKEEQCFYLEQGYVFFNFQMMILESQYDPFTLKKVLGVDCVNKNGSLSDCSSSQIASMESFRSERLVKLFEMANFKDNCFWSLACAPY